MAAVDFFTETNNSLLWLSAGSYNPETDSKVTFGQIDFLPPWEPTQEISCPQLDMSIK